MLKKTIKKVLKNKIKAWAESVTDERVKQAILNDTIVTGGAIVSLVNNETPNDYDIYFRTFGSLKLVTDYYVRQFNVPRKHVKAHVDVMADDQVCNYNPINVSSITRGTQYCGDCGSYLDCTLKKRIKVHVKDTGIEFRHTTRTNGNYKPKFLTSNAITLEDDIQIVIRFWGETSEIHKNYDFVHCTGSYDSSKDKVIIPSNVYDCIVNKSLRYQGSKYPLCSIVRLRKFIARGYTINAGEILKMCFQLSQMNLKNIAVLEEQLTGVDMDLFGDIIQRFREKIKEDSAFEIQSAFLNSIIDEVFNGEKLFEIRSNPNNPMNQ